MILVVYLKIRFIRQSAIDNLRLTITKLLARMKILDAHRHRVKRLKHL